MAPLAELPINQLFRVHVKGIDIAASLCFGYAANNQGEPMASPKYLHLPDVDMVAMWQDAKAKLDAWKNYERELREEIIERTFDVVNPGTNRRALPDGRWLKVVKPVTYDIDKDVTRVQAAMHNLSMRTTNREYVNNILRWSADLNVKVYKSLPTDLKAIIDNIVTMKLGNLQASIEEPKE